MKNITVTINGEPKILPENQVLESWMKQQQLDQCAVEHNHNILQRSEWAETLLKDQDILEIIRFVGGG